MRIINSVLLIALLSSIAPVRAQSPVAAPAGANAAKVHAILPQEAVGCLSVRLQQIKADQALRLIPWEIISAASLDGIGIDVSDMERFDLVVGPIAEKPGIAGVLTGKSKLDLSKLHQETFQLSADGKSYRILGDRSLQNFVIVPLNDSQVAVAEGELLGPFWNAPRGPGELQKQMQRLGENGHVTLVFVPGPIRELLLQGIASMPPEFGTDAKTLAEKVQLVAAKAQVDSNVTINVLIEAANESDAEAVEGAWNRLSAIFVREALAEAFQVSSVAEISESMQAYMLRASTEARALLKPTRKGARLLLTVDQRAINFFRGVVTYFNLNNGMRGVMGGGRGGPMSRNLRSTDTNKLKELGLAAHNYHDAFRVFPLDGDSSPRRTNKNLSWRVNVLPFIEQGELYSKFNQNEPWDSETNIKLLEKMPDIYRYSKAKLPPGHTVIHMPRGPGLISENDKRISMRDIRDGTSNTILLALSTDEAAVPWTKPDDFNPLEDLALIRRENGQITLVLADGSVSTLANPSPEELKRLLTRDGND